MITILYVFLSFKTTHRNSSPSVIIVFPHPTPSCDQLPLDLHPADALEFIWEWHGWDFANTITTPETQAENPNQRKLYRPQSLTSAVTTGTIGGKK